jgi:hypothetical protein
LTVISGRRLGALRQFLKLPTEGVVHPQLYGDFSCNIDMVRPPRIPIGFLQENDVGLDTGQKLNHSIEVQTSIDIPADNPNRVRREDHQAGRSKSADLDLFERTHGIFHVPLKIVRPTRPILAS